MVKTIDNITSPLPGTKIRPLYTYNDEQKALLKTLSEVGILSIQCCIQC